MTNRLLLPLLLLGLLLGASACGNKGELYLPGEEDEKAERKDY